MRLGFSIILNGRHHLEHGEFVKNMLNTFDLWVIVEGFAHPNGSTDWCKEVPSDMITKKGLSVDGTSEAIMDIWQENPNVEYVTPPAGQCGWTSKDHMVNAACDILRRFRVSSKYENNYLWQVDIDEQWEPEEIYMAENDLKRLNADCGCFYSDYYVGKDLVARGVWGEGKDEREPLRNAYRRLWLWKGQGFATHEPPTLDGGNGHEALLEQRFRHYAYYFEKDVAFKEKYYGYKDLVNKWKSLPKDKLPIPVSRLIPGGWGNTDTVIVHK